MAVVACVTTAIVLLFAVCKVAPRTGLALWHFSARWYAGIRLIRTGIIIVLHHLFFETLSGLGGKESEVLNFLVCAMRNSDNTYTGPMKKIAENVNCSKATVQRAMDTLTDKGFVAMEFDCVWRINPSMVIKGNRNKEKVLMDDFLMIQAEYNEKRKARKNGKKQKTVKG